MEEINLEKTKGKKKKIFIIFVIMLIIITGFFAVTGTMYLFGENSAGTNIINNALSTNTRRHAVTNLSNSEVMYYDNQGNLRGLGNLTYNDSVNGYGYFRFLGVLTQRIIKGFFIDLDVSGSVNSTYINASIYYEGGNRLALNSSLLNYIQNNSGTGGYIPQFQSGNIINNSVIYQKGSSIGIGTTNPSRILDIQGTNAFSASDGSQGVGIRGNLGIGEIFGINPSYATFNNLSIRTTTAIQLYLSTNGNIGIGTAIPSAKLDVRGVGNFSGKIYLNNNTDISIWMYNQTLGGNAQYNFTTNNFNGSGNFNTTGSIQTNGLTTTGVSYLGKIHFSSYSNIQNVFYGYGLLNGYQDNYFFSGEDRFNVTYGGTWTATSKSTLFDGNYDQYSTNYIPTDSEGTVRIDFVNGTTGYSDNNLDLSSGITYTNGYFVLSFYGDGDALWCPTEGNLSAHLINRTGDIARTLSFTKISGASNCVFQAFNSGYNYIIAVQFNITASGQAPWNRASLSEIEYIQTRPNGAPNAMLNKYTDQRFWHDLNFYNYGLNLTIGLDADSGDITSNGSIYVLNKIGIGTKSPLYPLHIATNTSLANNSISIFVQGNISATGFITRTSVYDKSQGSALDKIKDASEYKNQDGTINHKAFYGYVGGMLDIDYSKPIIKNIEESNCTMIDKLDNKENIISPRELCNPYIRKETTYGTKVIEGVELGMEIDLLRQAIYELKTENNRIKKCLIDSKNFNEYKLCVNEW